MFEHASAFSSINSSRHNCNHSIRTNVATPQKTTLSSSFAVDEEEKQATAIVEEDSIPTTAVQRSYLDDGFVFGLEGSGLERPTGKEARVVVEGDSLETQPWQVALVSATMMFHAAFSAYNVHEVIGQTHSTPLGLTESAVAIVSSWVMADLGSGILHWSVDNYGNGSTPVMGNIIAAFQGHHSAPWTITERGFCNNVYKLCTPFGIPTVLALSYLTGFAPLPSLFIAVFCAMEILSQELHKWSHMTKKEVPGWVNWMQDAGLSIPRTDHANHHKAPYEGNYCIVSGVCNPALDQSGFFRRLEHLVYNINGVESNSWKLDGALRAKTLNGDYSL